MTRLILAAGAVLVLSELTPAQAQFHGPAHGFHHGYSFRSGFGYGFAGPHVRFGFAGGFVTRSAFVASPFGFGGFGGFGPVGFRPFGFGPFGVAPFGPVAFRPFGPFGPVAFGPAGFWRFNPFGFGFGNPFWGGWGPGFGGFGLGFGPQVVAVPVPVVVGGNFPDPDATAVGPAPPPDDRALLPKGNYLVISPKGETTNPPVLRVAAKPKLPGPVLVFDPFKVPAKVTAEVAEVDPKKEVARLIKLGRTSFAAGDYGRAAENFERAITADPDEAKTYFLLGQAKFAAGQYAEAVARIRAGLARDIKWPNTAFDPTELYGERPERFVLHLLALKKALNENPNEATLEFLVGYQLWFSGDKIEADKFFRAAEKRLAAPGPIALFKLP